MAVTFDRHVAGTSSASSTTATVDLSACSVGDLAFVIISRAATAAPTTVPSGWTLRDSHLATYGIWLYWKVLESGDLTPDVPPHVRIALQGVCSEIRRHLNGVMRMVWVLRSLPEDVQRENGAGGPGGPPPGMDPQQQQ